MHVSFVRWSSRDNYLEPLSVYIDWIIQTDPNTSVTAMEHVNQTNKRVQGMRLWLPQLLSTAQQSRKTKQTLANVQWEVGTNRQVEVKEKITEK